MLVCSCLQAKLVCSYFWKGNWIFSFFFPFLFSDAKILTTKFHKSIIHSKAAMTYEAAQNRQGGDWVGGTSVPLSQDLAERNLWILGATFEVHNIFLQTLSNYSTFQKYLITFPATSFFNDSRINSFSSWDGNVLDYKLHTLLVSVSGFSCLFFWQKNPDLLMLTLKSFRPSFLPCTGSTTPRTARSWRRASASCSSSPRSSSSAGWTTARCSSRRPRSGQWRSWHWENRGGSFGGTEIGLSEAKNIPT